MSCRKEATSSSLFQIIGRGDSKNHELLLFAHSSIIPRVTLLSRHSDYSVPADIWYMHITTSMLCHATLLAIIPPAQINNPWRYCSSRLS